MSVRPTFRRSGAVLSAFRAEGEPVGLRRTEESYCHWSEHGREVPSFWGRQSTAATYQDDHFFASQSLAGSVTDCWVDDNPLTRILSDHGPVVLEIEAAAG